jgi:hypothetical protein
VDTPKDCDDSDGCTFDSCDPVAGCYTLDQSEKCNDNLACTTDTCHPNNGSCSYVLLNCSYLDDLCHTSQCDNYQSNLSLLCVKESIVCPKNSNCTSAECLINYTDSNGVLRSGCKNTTFDCAFAYFGVLAGLVGGAIAGIVIAAAIILCCAMVGGGAYAVSQSTSHSTDSNVKENPLYRKGVKTGTGIDC